MHEVVCSVLVVAISVVCYEVLVLAWGCSWKSCYRGEERKENLPTHYLSVLAPSRALEDGVILSCPSENCGEESFLNCSCLSCCFFGWFETLEDLVVSSSSSLPFGCVREIQSEKKRPLSCLFTHGFPLERAWGIAGTVLGGVLVLSLDSRLAHDNAAGK